MGFGYHTGEQSDDEFGAIIEPHQMRGVIKGNLSEKDVQIEADPVIPRTVDKEEVSPRRGLGASTEPTGELKGSAPTLPTQFQPARLGTSVTSISDADERPVVGKQYAMALLPGEGGIGGEIDRQAAGITRGAASPGRSITDTGVSAYKKALGTDTKIKLGPVDKQGNSHNYNFIDQETGKTVGGVTFELQRGGKDLHIDYVDAWKLGGPGSLGTTQMRSLLKEVKEKYPDAERLYGYRVSGARSKADTTSEAWIPLKPGVRVMDKIKASQEAEKRGRIDRPVQEEPGLSVFEGPNAIPRPDEGLAGRNVRDPFRQVPFHEDDWLNQVRSTTVHPDQ